MIQGNHGIKVNVYQIQLYNFYKKKIKRKEKKKGTYQKDHFNI